MPLCRDSRQRTFAATPTQALQANALALSMHVVDAFTCLLDQVDIPEMGELVESVGRYMEWGDSFSQSVFNESLKRVF